MRIAISDYVDAKEVTINKTPDTLFIDVPSKVSASDLLKVIKIIMATVVARQKRAQ